MARVLLSEVRSYKDLNDKVGYTVSEPYDEYYRPMKISNVQKSRRTDLAKRLDTIFEGLLITAYESQRQYSIISGLDEINRLSGTMVYRIEDIEEARQEYLDAVDGIYDPDRRLPGRADEAIYGMLAVLMRHLDDAYYYSRDRARAIAEEEGNFVYEYSELAEALRAGYTRKRWNTIMDGRERDSHAELNGTVIPIDQPFMARGGLLQFPGDDSMGVSDEELVNCRCSLSYQK